MNRKRPAAPFADIVREVTSSPAHCEEPHPGRYGDVFVDGDQQVYELVTDDIDASAALRLATDGAAVAWDACGCGGGCSGLRRFTEEEVRRMVLCGPPTIHRTERRYGRIDHLRACDGSSLLMVENAVSWGGVLG